MSIRNVLCFLAVLLTIPTLSLANPCMEGGALKNDGSCWNSMDHLEKVTIIRGIWTGQRISNITADLVGNSNAYGFLEFDHSSQPEQTTIGDIVSYFDELYGYPVNRKINWTHAYLLSSSKFRDDDSNDRLKLLSFLRDYGSIPTSGTLVGIKDIDVITVRTNVGVLDIKLSGVAKPANNEIMATALNFMGQLKNAGWGKCDEENNYRGSVSLRYLDDFFSHEGLLSAYVKIYGSVCIGKRQVSLSELSGSSDFYLNTFLLSKGLASRDPYIDPKWSRTRNTVRDINLTYPKAGQEKGLYLFGGNKDPLIEFVASDGSTPY